jgi:hypothetical protein
MLIFSPHISRHRIYGKFMKEKHFIYAEIHVGLGEEVGLGEAGSATVGHSCSSKSTDGPRSAPLWRSVFPGVTKSLPRSTLHNFNERTTKLTLVATANLSVEILSSKRHHTTFSRNLKLKQTLSSAQKSMTRTKKKNKRISKQTIDLNFVLLTVC